MNRILRGGFDTALVAQIAGEMVGKVLWPTVQNANNINLYPTQFYQLILFLVILFLWLKNLIT